MSSKLIELAQHGDNVCVALLGVAIALLVVLGISGVLYSIHSRKEKRLREQKYEADRQYSKRRNEILELQGAEFAARKDELDEAREEKEKVYQEVDEKIKAQDKRYNVIDNVLSVFRTGFGIMVWVLLMYVLLLSNSLGGTFSGVREVKDTQKDNVVVSAYYRIDYERVEQDTLTVFVKNNSDKVLDKAQISEKETGASAYVYTLEPGQEKIVSITVFPNDDDKYEFEISNVEFKQ